MAVPLNTFFEERLERLLSVAARVEKLFSAAGVDYRLVGGLATYFYVEEARPDLGRLTRDVDVAIHREDLDTIAKHAPEFGFEYRHVAGVDMLLLAGDLKAARAVHLLFTGEKVRPDYTEPVPALGTANILNGLRLIPIPDLVRMKLTSFRAKDEAHVKDLDEAGLITPAIEDVLSPLLRERLAQTRARD